MTDPLVIREFREDDPVPEIRELLHRAYSPLAAKGFRYHATHQDDAVTLERPTSGTSFLGECAGAIIATISLYPPRKTSDSAWYRNEFVYSFGQFAVHPDFQRQGIGQKMIDKVEAQARRFGARELALDTAEGAIHLRDWYTRQGFRFIEFASWEVTNYRSVILSKTLW